MNTIKTTGDHDAIAEDRPESAFSWREIELASYTLGSLGSHTQIEYIAAVNEDGETSDHRWQTRREDWRYPGITSKRWCDPCHHDTALDALESANLYLDQAEQKPLASLLIIIGTLYSQAAITLLKS